MAAPLTAPWDVGAESAVRSTLRDVVTARANHPSWPAPIELAVVSGTITFDETWSPHVQATFDCVLPDQAVVAKLDPRDLVRIEVDTGYVYPGGELDVHPFVNLGLRTRTIERPSNLLRLTAMSDEMLLQDAGTSLEAYAHAGIALPSLLSTRLPVALGYAPTLDLTKCPTTLVPVEFTTRKELWPTFKEAVDVAAAWLRDRGDRTWVCTTWPDKAAQPVHDLRPGPVGTVIGSTVEVTRNEWANAVAVSYQDPANTSAPPVVGWAWLTGSRQGIAGAGGPAKPGLRFYREERSAAATQAQATSAAAAILSRKARSARSAQVTARSAWWVRAGSTVTLRLPTVPEELHLVARVSFDLAQGSMNVQTRLPETADIATGA